MADTDTQPAGNALEVDENTGTSGDADSAYNDTIGSASYMTSLNSTVKNYKYENGRRYHAYQEGSYIVPNDEEEQDRIDLMNHVYCLLLGGELYMAPISDKVQRVLDLGTGTGIWAIQCADEHPSAQVIGTDLSPIQPSWVPPNCQFQIDDFENEWVFTTKFDYIHGRELEGAVANEAKLFKQAFDHLKPGGYFEFDGGLAYFKSDDGTHEKAENGNYWSEMTRNAGEKFGKSFENNPKWKEMMEQAGFVDVKQKILKAPIGSWPKDEKMKEIGRFQQCQMISVVDSYTPALFTRVLGWSKLEVDILIAKVKNELKDRNLHLYVEFYFVWGQKPEASIA